MLYADREFIGHVWIQGLARRGVPICVRLRLDTLVDEWPARDWLQILKPVDTGLWVEDVDVELDSSCQRPPQNKALNRCIKVDVNDGYKAENVSFSGKRKMLPPGRWMFIQRRCPSW